MSAPLLAQKPALIVGNLESILIAIMQMSLRGSHIVSGTANWEALLIHMPYMSRLLEDVLAINL